MKCNKCQYYHCGSVPEDWNKCDILYWENFHPNGCIYVDENGNIDRELIEEHSDMLP